MATQLITPKKTAIWLWAGALVLSAGLHVGLVRLNPNLFLGSGDFGETPARENRQSVRVEPRDPQRMKQELPKLLDRFDPVSQALPATESPIDLPEAADAFLNLAPVVLPQPQIEHRSAALSQESPEMAETPTDWQPRQEVMAITDQRVTETLDVLPRSFRAVADNQPGAPDITLPGIVPDLGTGAGEFTASFQTRVAAPEVSDNLPGMFGLETAAGPGNPDLLTPDTLSEIEMPEIESVAEITDLDAVETLLTLETRVFDDPENDQLRYFKIQLLPQGLDALPVLPRDVVYLVDCSASMTERKLRLAAQGIQASLETLSDTDTANVIAFRDQVELLDTEGVTANVFGKAKVRTFLSGLHAHGQTDVYASLDALQKLPRNPQRPMLALLVTDGVPTQGMTDSSVIIEQFSNENQGKISVFGLGAGGRVNRLLLDFLSYRNRGASLVSPQTEALPATLLQGAEEVRRPVLMNLSVQFTGAQEPEVYPAELSHLYLDRPLIMIGRVPKSQKQVAFQIVGTSASGEHDLLFTLDLDKQPQGSSSLRQEWAWQALLERLSTSITHPDLASEVEVQRLIESYNLVIPDAYQQ
ncbi:VWA domain-containing protein [Kiritimatiellota bacterium B12222]|nr:VWA domain-containing protein [Kiritimatiellota bacterium B12222]